MDIEKNDRGRKNPSFLRSWFVEGHHPFLTCRHEVVMHFVTQHFFFGLRLVSGGVKWRPFCAPELHGLSYKVAHAVTTFTRSLC